MCGPRLADRLCPPRHPAAAKEGRLEHVLHQLAASDVLTPLTSLLFSGTGKNGGWFGWPGTPGWNRLRDAYADRGSLD